MKNGQRLRAKRDARSGAWKRGDTATFLDKPRPEVELDRERLFAVRRVSFETLRVLEEAFRRG